jgi:hypothetical protein
MVSSCIGHALASCHTTITTKNIATGKGESEREREREKRKEEDNQSI